MKVNFTISLDESEVPRFQNWLENNVKVIDFNIFTDTSKLYESSTTFRGLCKAEKMAKRAKNDYINEHK